VWQHNSGAVEDFILPYSAVYLRIQRWKNYWNRSTFAKVTVKIKVFLNSQCILYIMYVQAYTIGFTLHWQTGHQTKPQSAQCTTVQFHTDVRLRRRGRLNREWLDGIYRRMYS